MLTPQEKKSILRNTKVFARIPGGILARIIEALEVVSFKAGDTILRKGDPGTSMFIVIDGQARVHDGALIFRMAGKGDVFGEMAALDPDVRSATITAETDITLFQLDQQAVYDLMRRQMEVTREIIHILCEYVRNSSEDWADDFQQRVMLEREMEIGRSIQASFLPDEILQERGWEIAANLKIARQVSGDFYDVFRLPYKNRIGLVVGDVCDKGLGAALFMTIFRSLLRANATAGDFLNWMEPSSGIEDHREAFMADHAILRRSVMTTNNYIAHTHGETSMFATLFFALLDPHTGSLVYINAGHEAPIILNPKSINQSSLVELHPTAPAIGLFPDVDIEIKETRLKPGDTLLVYTDGVVDTANQADEMYGRGRLFTLLQDSDLSASELLDTIGEDLAKYATGAKQQDDITLLAARRLS